MAEFTLPKNSQIDKKGGQVYKAKEGAKKVYEVQKKALKESLN